MRNLLLIILIAATPLVCNHTLAQAINPPAQPADNPQYRAALRSWIVRERLLTEYEQRTIKDFKLTEEQRAELDKQYQIIEADYVALEKMIADGTTPTRQQMFAQDTIAANQKVLAILGPLAKDAFTNKSPRHDMFQIVQVISSNLLGIGVSDEQFVKSEAILMPVFQAAAKMPQTMPADQAEQIAMGTPVKQALVIAVRQLKQLLDEKQLAALVKSMPFLEKM